MGEMLLLAGLWLSAFTSATILPGSSEPALTAFVLSYPDWTAAAFWTAAAGNTAGSMVSYAMGRLLPERAAVRAAGRALPYLQRFGAWSLLLAWLPLVGDVLPPAAGALRLNALHCAAALAAGKSARYGILVCGVSLFQAA